MSSVGSRKAGKSWLENLIRRLRRRTGAYLYLRMVPSQGTLPLSVCTFIDGQGA